MRYDPLKHHRRSIRLKGYDYSQEGAYYVTIVADHRECLFGEIENGKMRLNDFGKIVQEEWLQTARVRPNVELGEYVVMPNHLHGIIVINNTIVVGANRRFAPTKHPRAPIPNSIGAIMMQFKSIVTKRINAVRGTQGAPVWQRNYHERIVRNDDDLDRICTYIINNPFNWESDDENPKKVRQR
jgi:REP element-mobilizing transposase RayT